MMPCLQWEQEMFRFLFSLYTCLCSAAQTAPHSCTDLRENQMAPLRWNTHDYKGGTWVSAKMITYTASADGDLPHPEARIMRAASTSSSSEYPNKHQGKLMKTAPGQVPGEEGLPGSKENCSRAFAKIQSLAFN